MSKGLKEEVKVVVNSLLVPHSNGLSVDRLLKEYTDAEFKPFPFRELGFNSPLDFLRSIPDVANVVTLRSGHVFVHAVANDNISHIHELVQGQKKSQGTGFKVFNRLTNGQSDHRKPFLLPTPYNNRNKPNNYSNGGSRNTSYNTNYNTSRMNGHKPPPSTSSQLSRIYRTDVPPPPSSYTGFCVENELQLTTEFQNLLQSYPEGIAISNAFGLYSRKYQKPSPIQEPLPLIYFFEKHADVFKKWKKDGNTIVALKNPQPVPAPRISEPNSSQPPQVERSSLLGAIPKVFPAPQRMPTPEVVYRPMTETPNQLKWAATDIRVQSPSNKAIQTLTVAWDCNPTPSPTSNPNLRKVTPVSVRLPQREGNLPATFGVPKPKIKNVCEPGSDIPRQEVPPEGDNYEYFFIIVAEVYSPGQFYWFLSENRGAIEGLTDDMTLFYNMKPEYVISRSEMYIGQLVAAMYTDNLWYRARIVKCYEDEFEVFYVDYGSKSWVTIDRIRHLGLHFTQLPIQAFCGRIFGVRHLPTEKKWSTEAGRCFLDLVKGSKTIAAMKMSERKVDVGENESETICTLALVDTTAKDKDVHISDHLIENGFAVVDQEEAASLRHIMSSTATSPDENNSILIPSPSPLPTCAFPLSASNSLAPQLDNGRLSPNLNQMRETNAMSPERFMRNGQASSVISRNDSETILDEVEALSVSSSDRESYGDSQHLVKQIVLSDGRKLHTVQYEGDLYLPKFDLMVLIPNLERQMASFKMGIENKSISVESHPEIFAEMNEAGPSWIKDKSQPVTQLILYSLQHVSSLVFLFSPSDKIASSAIVAELKEFNAPC